GVGLARLGGPFVAGLARCGVRDITGIDPDVLEEHSRDASEVLGEAVAGRHKTEAVAAFLAAVEPRTHFTGLSVPAEHPTAAEALCRADLVFSAPDRNRARLVAALCATAHHRAHVDIGTGVFDDGEFVAGADVRLIVPGQ